MYNLLTMSLSGREALERRARVRRVGEFNRAMAQGLAWPGLTAKGEEVELVGEEGEGGIPKVYARDESGNKRKRSLGVKSALRMNERWVEADPLEQK